MSDGTSGGGTYQCPYPDCEWSPSRPTDSEVRLTQVVVSHEVDNHREEHTDSDDVDRGDGPRTDGGSDASGMDLCQADDVQVGDEIVYGICPELHTDRSEVVEVKDYSIRVEGGVLVYPRDVVKIISDDGQITRFRDTATNQRGDER